jgi:Tfp pilus assembly protein PilO
MSALGRVVRGLAWLFLGVNAYGAFVLLYALTWGAAQEARTDRAASLARRQREEVRVLEVTLAKHDLFEAEGRQLEQKLAVLSLILPRSPGMEKVEGSLRALAQGVTVLEVTPGPPAQREFHVMRPLTVRVRGPLPALAAFLTRLERLPRLLVVRRMAASAEAGALTATLELEAYHRTSR